MKTWFKVTVKDDGEFDNIPIWIEDPEKELNFMKSCDYTEIQFDKKTNIGSYLNEDGEYRKFKFFEGDGFVKIIGINEFHFVPCDPIPEPEETVGTLLQGNEYDPKTIGDYRVYPSELEFVDFIVKSNITGKHYTVSGSFDTISNMSNFYIDNMDEVEKMTGEFIMNSKLLHRILDHTILFGSVFNLPIV